MRNASSHLQKLTILYLGAKLWQDRIRLSKQLNIFDPFLTDGRTMLSLYKTGQDFTIRHHSGITFSSPTSYTGASTFS